MNTNQNQSQRQRRAAHRRFGILAATTIAAQVLAAMPAQASSAQQMGGITIDEVVVTAINQLYLNQSTTYQLQWTQLIKDLAPTWRFARAVSHTTCLPAPAYNDKFVPNPGASLKAWPVPGQSGCTATERTDQMVTYVDPKLCDANTLRFGYWLYFMKDGFALAGGTAGHRHDWEFTVVELKRAQSTGTTWVRNQIIGSYHHTVQRKLWMDSGLQKTDDGKHPIMFVGWAHHAMHWDKGGRADVASTATDDVRNSYLKLDSWNNLVIIPMQPKAAREVLNNGPYFDRATPPLNKDICTV